jgi:hypothetical protein
VVNCQSQQLQRALFLDMHVQCIPCVSRLKHLDYTRPSEVVQAVCVCVCVCAAVCLQLFDCNMQKLLVRSRFQLHVDNLYSWQPSLALVCSWHSSAVLPQHIGNAAQVRQCHLPCAAVLQARPQVHPQVHAVRHAQGGRRDEFLEERLQQASEASR